MMQIDELRRLLSEAGLGTLRQGEMDPQGVPYVGGTLTTDLWDDLTNADVAQCEHVEYARLIAAAVNALPALLAVAEAAREWEEAQRLYVGMFEASDHEGAVAAAEYRLNRAEDALRAALIALEAPDAP